MPGPLAAGLWRPPTTLRVRRRERQQRHGRRRRERRRAPRDEAPPPACDGAGNPLFGSCIDTFLAGCFEPDRGGSCTKADGTIRWSDGSTYVQPTPSATAGPGFYRPGETSPCVSVATDSNGSTLTKGGATIRFVSSDAATITCPDLSTITASPAQVTTFNRCRGITCPPSR